MRASQVFSHALKKVPVYFVDKDAAAEEQIYQVSSLEIDNKDYQKVWVKNQYEEVFTFSRLKFFSQKEYTKHIQPVYYKNKTPKTRTKYLGIEIEFISTVSRVDLCMMLSKKGLSEYVTVSDDGSIDVTEEYEIDIEVKILVPQNKYKTIVPKILKVLKRVGQVNRSCGLHVHLDMRSRNASKCYTKLVNSLEYLKTKVSPDRVDGEYCRLNTYNNMDNHTKHSSNRYWAINPQSLAQHKTLEVRMKESTLDSKEVLSWINDLITIVDKK